MKNRVVFIILTLVVRSLLAAPRSEINAPTIDQTLYQDQVQNSPIYIEKKNQNPLFFVGTSIVSGALTLDKKTNTTLLMTLEIPWQKNPDYFIWNRLSIFNNKYFLIDTGYRSPCLNESIFFKLRPYYDLGFRLLINPADQFTNFVNYERYFFHSEIGFKKIAPRFDSLSPYLGASIGYLGWQIEMGLKISSDLMDY